LCEFDDRKECFTCLRIRIVDAVTFVHDDLLPRLNVTRRLDSVALHSTCSSNRLGFNDTLGRLAHKIADAVRVSADWSCCGFAGDRGLLHPS
jgi:D-lactate dehydrogenase